MYISKVVIENYRCFGSKTEIKLKPGVNEFIGENNSGKTTVLNALGFLFDRRGRSQLGIDDFNKNLEPSTRAPKITVTASLSSTGKGSKIFAIPSVPCFEFWLLLHFAYTTRPFDAPAGDSVPEASAKFLIF